MAALVAAGCLLLAAGGAAYFGLGTSGGAGMPVGPLERPVQPNDAASPADIETALWFGTEQSRKGSPRRVTWLTLLALNHTRGRAAVVYIPAHAAAEIPGRGLHSVGDAFLSGGARLLLVSAENLLGIPIDDYMVVDPRRARSLFASLGPLNVDVPVEVKAAGGSGAVLFSPGEQKLRAQWLTRLMFTAGVAGDDIEFGPRHLSVWESLLRRFGAPRGGAQRRNLPPFLSAASSGRVQLLRGIASVGKKNLTLTGLPVSQVGMGADELYTHHPPALAELLEDALGAPQLHDDEVQVQILNGNGVPGVGAKVAQRLVGKGYRVALSGNAPRLDHPKTLIVAYVGSAGGQSSAARVRKLLGTGEIRLAAQAQGIVDLTIVVGEDFSPR